MNLQQLPIKYELVLDEINLVIEALAELPFKKSEPLITKLRSVALAALDAEQKRVTAERVEKEAIERALEKAESYETVPAPQELVDWVKKEAAK